MTSYICVNIGCSSFLSTGILAAWVGDSLQRLATIQEFFIWDFSLFSDERHQQLAVVRHHSLNQIGKTLNSPCFPTLFAKFNLPQHRLALTSINREAKGRSALKATVEEEEAKGGVQTSFLWTKESVVQMFEGKQGKLFVCWGCASMECCFVLEIQGSLSLIESDARIGCEWT